jgi:hypothetical protein
MSTSTQSLLPGDPMVGIGETQTVIEYAFGTEKRPVFSAVLENMSVVTDVSMNTVA